MADSPLRGALLSSFLALDGLLMTGSALAEEQQQPAALEEVTVTGSHIVRDGMTAPTPVTVVSPARIEDLGTTNVGAVLNTLPSFRASTNPQTDNIQPRTGGASGQSRSPAPTPFSRRTTATWSLSRRTAR